MGNLDATIAPRDEGSPARSSHNRRLRTRPTGLLRVVSGQPWTGRPASLSPPQPGTGLDDHNLQRAGDPCPSTTRPVTTGEMRATDRSATRSFGGRSSPGPPDGLSLLSRRRGCHGRSRRTRASRSTWRRPFAGRPEVTIRRGSRCASAPRRCPHPGVNVITVTLARSSCRSRDRPERC